MSVDLRTKPKGHSWRPYAVGAYICAKCDGIHVPGQYSPGECVPLPGRAEKVDAQEAASQKALEDWWRRECARGVRTGEGEE